jgi:adenylate cyclase
MPTLTFSSKQHAVRALTGLLIVLFMLLHVSGALPLSPVTKLELWSYDTRLTMSMPNSMDERIVIVDIDEKSLKQQGHWPWSRNKLAHLVDRLFDDYQVRVLGVDAVFAEPDLSSGLQGMQAIQAEHFTQDQALRVAIEKLSPSLDYDQVFANSLKNRKVVLAYVFLQGEDGKVGMLPAPVLSAAYFKDQPVSLMQASGYTANLANLQAQAYAAGYFNASPDQDGISRRLPMLVQYHDQVYEAFASAVARAANDTVGMQSTKPVFAVDADAERLRIGGNSIPVNDDMAALIPYRGAQGSFRYVSATDVLLHKVDKAILNNKIVLLGTSAAGLMDLRATPMQNVYPGVEVHANMVAGILDGNIKQNPAYTQGMEFVLLLLVGSLLAFTLPSLSPARSTAVIALCLGLLLGLNCLAWQFSNLVLPLAALLVTLSALYFFNMAYGFFFESRLKRQLGRLFGLYIPPELVEEMANNPNSYSLASQSRQMTVLFTDVRDFTAIAEGMAPEQLSLLMSRFLSPMTQAIHQHRGTIDKYMGDAIMAFWGAPVTDKQHATHAVEAALAMNDALARLQDDFAALGWPAIRIGIGLNSGDMVVGNMGSTFRMAYTVLGDAVNLGSRLEGLTKYYAVSIIVSESTKALAPDFVYKELDRVRVKGRDKPLAIYEVIGKKTEVDERVLANLQQYQAALAAYRNQDWPKAETLFTSLSHAQPLCRLYAIYMERIGIFKGNPPTLDWDGVVNFNEKR